MASTRVRLLPPRIRKVLRPLARRVGLAAAPGAWDQLGGRIHALPRGPEGADPCVCNICHWSGQDFSGPYHCEMAGCPRCGSISRDRFLMLGFLARTPYRTGLRVLETSPRNGAPYRRAMRRSFDYTASDFDLSAHEGDVQIDLQDIDMPDDSLDVLLTPHVLEHVPDTRRALREVFRVLAPGGRMYLQVPLCRGLTAIPQTPEFHADNTPVFYNFGWDLTDMIREAGFSVRVLVTEEFFDLIRDRSQRPTAPADGFDLQSMWDHAQPQDCEPVVDRRSAGRLGLLPPHHFVTWECVKPGRAESPSTDPAGL